MKSTLSIFPWGRGLLPALVLLFFLVRLGEMKGIAPGWIRHYGDDFICLPLVLSLTLVVHRLAAADRRTLPVHHGLLAVAVFTVYFELILPVTGFSAVGDPLDGLMYLAGFLLFQFFINRDVAVRGDRTEIPGKIFPSFSPTKLFRRNHGHF